MDRLAYEDHTHIATEEEIDVFRGNWWIRSNFVGSDTMPVRHRPDFKKALSTFSASRKRRIKRRFKSKQYRNSCRSTRRSSATNKYKVVAARSKAKAKPQPRVLVGTTATIPMHERRWIDIEPSKQNLVSYDLSKKVISLLPT